MSDRFTLARFIRIGHPNYRARVGGLLAIGLVSAGAVYLESYLLHGIIQALDAEHSHEHVAVRWLASLELGDVALLLLPVMLLVSVLRSALVYLRIRLNYRMFIDARDDLERQVLSRLLRFDEAFYAEHSVGEIMGRLDVDLVRVLDRREQFTTLVWSLLLAGGSLTFFAIQSLKYAVLVVVLCVAGTLITELVGRPLGGADRRFFAARDRIRADFEDYLRAIPEIQAGGLFARIVKRYHMRLDARRAAHLDHGEATGRIHGMRLLWPGLAFAVTVGVLLWLTHKSDEHELALVPVLIWALPGIFKAISDILALRVDWQLSNNAIVRILDYDKELESEEEDGAWLELPPPTGVRVVADDASFQYRNEDGQLSGGVSEVSLSLEPGDFVALVGGAGSGKSTLVNMLLGRNRPQSGRVTFRDGDGAELDELRLRRAASLMPQKVALFDATISENLRIGSGRDGDFTTEDLTTMEATGLAAICRLKALEMPPADDPERLADDQLLGLRERARATADAMGLELSRYEDGAVDPSRALIEGLLRGRCDWETYADQLLRDDDADWLRQLADHPVAAELEGHARHVLGETRHLLEVSEYKQFTALSPTAVPQALWRLRRDALAAQEARGDKRAERNLLRVALTATPEEWGLDGHEAQSTVMRYRKELEATTKLLRAALGDDIEAFDPNRVHRRLTWRDNMLFGYVHMRNQRQRRRLDEALLDVMAEEGFRDFFTRQGLEFRVGRNGSRLSGGQGQLVAFNRAVLRYPQILVLDEPTSALDPKSRERVTEFLKGFCEGRIVIAISHDPEFVRHAQRALVLSRGRLADEGSFDELAEASPTFRKVFGLS